MKLFIGLITAIVLLLASFLSSATDIRGRIDTQNLYNGYYQPLPKAEVALVNPATNQFIAVTYTGMDGFYYFYNIFPGHYYLVVNRTLSVPVTIPNSPGFDINPVLFR